MTRYEENCETCGQPILRITHNTSDALLGIFNPDFGTHKCRKKDIAKFNKSKTAQS